MPTNLWNSDTTWNAKTSVVDTTIVGDSRCTQNPIDVIWPGFGHKIHLTKKPSFAISHTGEITGHLKSTSFFIRRGDGIGGRDTDNASP